MNHNNVRISKASSLTRQHHVSMDCMSQLDMDTHCILQDMTLRCTHLDNNDQLGMVD